MRNDVQSVFLAAPHHQQLAPVIDQIVLPALTHLHLKAVRMPRSNSKQIANEIFSAIEACDAMVAVVIGRNPNVFWELGLAFALGKPLVLLAEHEFEQGLLSNASHCVLYEAPDTTRVKLRTSLRALNLGRTTKSELDCDAASVLEARR